MFILRLLLPTLLVGCSIACSGVDRVDQPIVNEHQTSAESEKGKQVSEKEGLHKKISGDESIISTFEELRRVKLQEWLDHRQSAWLAAASLSELMLHWPRGVRAERIWVNKREVTIYATTTDAAKNIKKVLRDAEGLQNVRVSERMVTADVRAVVREFTPKTDDAVYSELQRLRDTHQMGESPLIAERNTERAHVQESDAFGCWERVEKKREGYRRVDGTLVEAGVALVRPDQPTVQVSQWSASTTRERGRAWERIGASIQLRGPFVSVLRGLDCARGTSTRYSIQSLNLEPTNNGSDHVVLTLEVALIRNQVWTENQFPPWGENAEWGDAPSPKRTPVLQEQTVIDPFSG